MKTNILAVVLFTASALTVGCRPTPQTVTNGTSEIRNHVFTMNGREYFFVCWLSFESPSDSYFRPIIVIDYRDFQEKVPSFYPVRANGLFPVKSGGVEIERPSNSIVFFSPEGNVIDLGTLHPDDLFKGDAVALEQKLDEISDIIKRRLLERN